MSGTRRLFFALWPSAPVRRALDAQAERLAPALSAAASSGSGRAPKRVPAHNLHLTLLFIGNVPSGRLADLERLGDETAGSRFTLRLDRFGVFERARVAWLGAAPSAEGDALVASLATGAADYGVEPDRRPWRPHVTLFRRVGPLGHVPPPAPVDWAAERFALVESIPGRPYQVLRSWPLQ